MRCCFAIDNREIVGRAVWLVLRKPESQQPEEEELMALLKAQHPDLADKDLFSSLLNEVEEMQSILVATLNKLKA